MKNKLKLYTSISLLLALLVVCVIGLTGCDKESDSEIEQIYITSNHSPRLTYVEGQDLDLIALDQFGTQVAGAVRTQDNGLCHSGSSFLI